MKYVANILKKLEVKTVAATDITSFNTILQEYVDEGWYPIGNLVVTHFYDASGIGMQYTQLLQRQRYVDPHKSQGRETTST